MVFDSGECFDAVSNRVDCAELHTREDFAIFDQAGTITPGDVGSGVETGGAVCEQLSEDYTGMAFDGQDRSTVMFSAGGFPERGVIEIRCSITSVTGALQPTTGSARRPAG